MSVDLLSFALGFVPAAGFAVAGWAAEERQHRLRCRADRLMAELTGAHRKAVVARTTVEAERDDWQRLAHRHSAWAENRHQAALEQGYEATRLRMVLDAERAKRSAITAEGNRTRARRRRERTQATTAAIREGRPVPGVTG